MNILKIGVVGSRRRDTAQDKELIRTALKYLIGKDPKTRIHLVSGGCPRGADRFAEELAVELGLGISIHYPDRSKLEADTKWAWAKIFFARNTLIAEECDFLMALCHADRKGGTEDTVKKAENLKKTVVFL